MNKDDDLIAWLGLGAVIVAACLMGSNGYLFHKCVEAQERLGRVCVAGMKISDRGFRQEWDATCGK